MIKPKRMMTISKTCFLPCLTLILEDDRFDIDRWEDDGGRSLVTER
ncbi:hypothetical protein SAMN05880501_11022 [Ureibacillus xyleni]|uniref:Uncharacterized protein n=1 Tax=Ureibacillus xyleni TaxID=614648 RepID=A0A285T903_9BACL|nr:hypothetical protein [Ureibacillus xyleni]SOC18039.1 hypothetical protein SAMN05880501_11022 [Ureibacillus xyleni]